MKYVCIHGHFYQPPRENPWLEAIEPQDEAAPYHDWNERINAECYAPNTASRILDDGDRIIDITNNYARISFDFGPTLLSWLEEKAPVVYRGVLDADRESRERFDGHGSAMAQAYNHAILPLASPEDKEIQVVWGIRDFESRFGRRPEGMWLPETAVDIETLEALAARDIRFTVLAPSQAARVRVLGETAWQDVSGARIDTTVPYRQRLPSGRSIAIFFYDGPASRAVAFERLLHRGENLARKLVSIAKEDGRPRLGHIATDGETYGHHHPHGDMALAFALRAIETQALATLTNYGAFLGTISSRARSRNRRKDVVELRPRSRTVAEQLRVQDGRAARLDPGLAGAAAGVPRLASSPADPPSAAGGRHPLQESPQRGPRLRRAHPGPPGREHREIPRRACEAARSIPKSA